MVRQGPQVLAAAPGAASMPGGREAGEAGLAGVGLSCLRAATISAFDRRLFRPFLLTPPAVYEASRWRCSAFILASGERTCRHICLARS